MGTLDFSRFGPLGYQDQIAQANASLDQVMHLRALQAKQAQDASTKNAEIALKNQELQLKLNKDAEEQRRHDQATSIEGTKAVLEHVKAGDEEGAQAIGSPYGITFDPEQAAAAATARSSPPTTERALPPEARALASRNIPPEAADVLDPLPEVPIHGTGDAQEPVETPKQRFNADTGEVTTTKPQVFDVGTIDITADVPRASVSRLDPSTQGSMEMAPADPPTTPPAGASPRKMTFHTPSGQTISVDPEQQRTAQRQRASQDFLQAHLAEADALFQSAAGKPPEVAAQIRAEATKQRGDIKRIAAHIASGAVEPKNAGNEAELGIRERAGQAITEKDRFLESGRNNRAAMAARAAAAGRRGDTGPGMPDPKVLARYQADVQNAMKNSGAAEDLKELKNLNRFSAELAKPNGPQFQLALDSMAKTASGGRLAVQIEQNLQNSAGPLWNLENKAYRLAHHGHNMPKLVNEFRKALADSEAVAKAQRDADAAAFEEKAGINSQWANEPTILPFVHNNRKAYYKQLGLQAPAEPAAQGESDVSDEDFINGR